MIKILRLSGNHSVLSRNRMEQVQDIFRQNFAALADYADQLPSRLNNPVRHGYRSILLIAESALNRVDAFALVVHFPDIGCAFLDFIASKDAVRGKGVGSALYEAIREVCQDMGVKGLYLEVQPDLPEFTPNPKDLEDAKRRVRFYEQYGVRIIDNAAYSLPVGDPPTFSFLMYDGLGQVPSLCQAEVKQAVESILTQRFRHVVDQNYIAGVMDSFTEDPVRFLPIRYVRAKEPRRLVKSRRLPKAFTVVNSPKHELHHVKEQGYFERPIRMEAIRETLANPDIFTPCAPRKYNDRHIHAVHDKDFVTYLRMICTKLKESRPVYPDTFPMRRKVHRPKVLAVQAGYYCTDTGTPLYANAYVAARATVDTAMTAADELLCGKRLVYAACRPPGHHAGKRFYGGFCYFNNAAIAAHFLSSEIRVAMLDIDFHHGNGTQDIFYERSDVLTLSIHGHPDYSYPYFSGYADETGEGSGLGYNQNFPLQPRCDDKKYLATFQRAAAAIDRFRPDALIVGLGFDILKGDPTGTFLMYPTVFKSIGRMLMEIGLPLLLVQEGGYNLGNIKRGCIELFKGVLEHQDAG